MASDPTQENYYNDLMDLIYTGGSENSPEDQPTVSVYEDSAATSLTCEPQAIPFVTVAGDAVDAGGEQLEISTEAMGMLDGMQHRKVAVVAICGSANSGKSFLANRYLGRMKGFKTRGLLGSGTRGIYLWN